MLNFREQNRRTKQKNALRFIPPVNSAAHLRIIHDPVLKRQFILAKSKLIKSKLIIQFISTEFNEKYHFKKKGESINHQINYISVINIPSIKRFETHITYVSSSCCNFSFPLEIFHFSNDRLDGRLVHNRIHPAHNIFDTGTLSGAESFLEGWQKGATDGNIRQGDLFTD